MQGFFFPFKFLLVIAKEMLPDSPPNFVCKRTVKRDLTGLEAVLGSLVEQRM